LFGGTLAVVIFPAMVDGLPAAVSKAVPRRNRHAGRRPPFFRFPLRIPDLPAELLGGFPRLRNRRRKRPSR
jgi:hypothetical protein